MDFHIEENPENLIIPLELSKVIYQNWNADLVILDKPDQVYGKALHGNGSVTFKNGNVYEGELHNGMMHGKGKFTWKNGVVYEGEFRYNAIEGQGKYFWPDGSRYEGEVKASLRDGKGTFVAPNEEATYTGEWKDGLRHGKGRIEFSGGAVYEGDFFNGYKHGFGKMTYPSGNFYEGNWKYDKKEGQGTMNWLNTNEKYYGNWRDNLQNGFGVHIWLEGKGEGKLLRNRYEGQWLDGQRHGYGIFYYANGSKYEGEWRNNLKEGYAVFTEDNGNITQGVFKADRLAKEKTVSKNVQASAAAAAAAATAGNGGGTNGANGGGDANARGAGAQGKKDGAAGASSSGAAAAGQSSAKKGAAASSNAKATGGATGAAAGGAGTAAGSGNAAGGANGNAQATSPTAAQVQQLASGQSQQAAAAAAAARKKEIEQNPFAYLVDFSDILSTLDGEDLQEQVLANLQNMLLRHNSSMRQWYKHYSVKYDNTIGEDAFAMDLQTFWKFVQESRVLDASTTLAAIDRAFLQGAKNRFVLKTEDGEVERQIETLKKLGRPLTLQELQDIEYITLTQGGSGSGSGATAKSAAQSGPLDWKNLAETEGNIFTSRKLLDVHQANRVILYRHFVELIVRTAYLKNPAQITDLHRTVEKVIVDKFSKLFEKQSQAAGGAPMQESKAVRPKSSVSDKSTLLDKRDWGAEHATALKRIYDAISHDNKNPAFGVLDKTARFKDVMRYLEKAGKLDPTSPDKAFLQSLIEHFFDPDQTLAHIDQLQKEELAKEKKKVTKKDQKKAPAPQQPSFDYEKAKVDAFARLLETEILYPEFEYIVIGYLFKREKDLHSNKESEVEKKLRDHIEKLVQFVGDSAVQSQAANTRKKPGRFWPKSEKDQMKQDLAVLRLKQKEEAEEKRRKNEERQREQKERVLMKLEDYNVPSEPEDDGYDDD